MEGRASSFEDFIIVSPEEVGKIPHEYCPEDESRPRLFGAWGAFVPIGRAVTKLFTSYLDSHKTSDSYMSNITVEKVPNTRHECAQLNMNDEAKDSDPKKSGDLASRRKSLRKANAFSSFDELETEYSLHRFKLHSRDNSIDDYFILKVKTKSLTSLASPTSHSKTFHLVGDMLKPYKGATNGELVEKDSPVYLGCNTESPKPASNPGSALLVRKGMIDKKALSTPERTDILPPDSLVNISPESSLTNHSGHVSKSSGKMKRPSEQHIKDIVTKYCDDFVKYSNWSALLPHLESGHMLDPVTKHKLMNSQLSDHEKGLHFYLTILPSQGNNAYTAFYDCLMKETEHNGHETLKEYLRPPSSC